MPEENRRIASISFEGVSCPVVPAPVHETYFAFDPPEGQPTLFVDPALTNDDVIAFVDQWLPGAREVMGDVARRYRKSPSAACRYRTGDVAYVLGRPFLVKVYGQDQGTMRKAARGRASSSARLVPQLSLVELFVMQPDRYDQRRGAFMGWADGVLVRNGASLFGQAIQRAGIDVGPGQVTFRAGDMRHGLVRFDRSVRTVWLSRKLVPYPPHCLAYACVREMASGAVSPDLVGEERAQAVQRLIQRGCPDWEDAKRLLEDEDSPFARQ